MGNQIEGSVSPGMKVLVVEDLISTGKSSLQVCDVLKEAGVEIAGMVSIFNYGFPEAAAAFEKAGVSLISLTNYTALSELAVSTGKINEAQMVELMKWRESPATWGVK